MKKNGVFEDWFIECKDYLIQTYLGTKAQSGNLGQNCFGNVQVHPTVYVLNSAQELG